MPDIDPTLRARVRKRAGWLCEYCGISERFTLAVHEIDHIIAFKHGGETVENNLALCCAVCNRFKGSDIASIDPETGEIVPLYHPRSDRWDEHFVLCNGLISPLTAKGRTTVKLLKMNRAIRIIERSVTTVQR